MTTTKNEAIDRMVEVKLVRPDAFLIIKETLTRIGVPSTGSKKLHQSCHILHKAGKYYIAHFKLLFELDGKSSNFDIHDSMRQLGIAQMLASWNLVEIVNETTISNAISLAPVKVVSSSEKSDWTLIAKHRIGNK